MEDITTKAIRAIVKEELKNEKPRIFPPLAPVPPFQLFSVKSAAKLLEVSVYYIYDRIEDGSLPRMVDLGGTRGKYRLRADDLQKFIGSRSVQSSKQASTTSSTPIETAANPVTTEAVA